MASANAPFTTKEVFTLPSIGINPECITSAHITMESDKYICIRETAPQSSLVIIDMDMPNQPLRRPITADSALMNPNSRILALKAPLPITTQDHLQIFNIETKMMMKSHTMPEQIVFWKWITPNMLGLVTQTSVYHWSIQGDSEPLEMFYRTANLTNNQIINYCCDLAEKWLVLIGTAPGSAERPQLVKGNMQLFSVDQQRSQALEAHTASFASFKVPGNKNPSTIICFASKTINAGKVTSKLYVIELGSEPGKPAFGQKQADLFFPPEFGDDFPVAMQISHKYCLIYVITKLGLLYVNDLETATEVYKIRISPDPILLTSEASFSGGFYAVNRRGQVLLTTVNEATIVPFVGGQLNNLELAVNLAKRGNLPGAENLVVQRFQEFFSQRKYKEAAEVAAESPQGILRTPDTVLRFQSVPVQGGETPPLLQYFGTLLTRGKLNAFESLELSRLVVNQNRKNLLENWLAEDKLECTEELGDLVKTVDDDLALKIYIKARDTPKTVASFEERCELDKMRIYSKQFVERFQELLSQMEYKEAAELAAESPQGILRSPDTVAKFQCVPVQAGQTPPLLHYFGTLLTRGKLNAFESLELSRIVVNQNKKNLLESWLAEDKLECSEELGNLVMPMDSSLALKILIKARVTPKEAVDRHEFDENPIYSKQTVDNDIVTPKFSPVFYESLPEKSFLERVEDSTQIVFGSAQLLKNSEVDINRDSVKDDIVDEVQKELNGLEGERRQNFDCKDDINEKLIETFKVVDVSKEQAHGSSNSIESKLGELGRKKIQQYSSEDLTSITKNFIDQIGSGAYGDVFKGKLPNGCQVAVKKLKDIAMNVMENTFIAEVRTMSSTLHRNLVRLYGYCFEANMKALVYEYLENGSLDRVLYENHLNLRWENLYDIAIGTALGLSYLHEGCDDVIVHYDVKPGNVLIDSKLCPKVADFGMAKISQRDVSHISVIDFRGTRSYAAPEMWMQMPVTFKSDIYSFGMMLFEVLGRRRNLDNQNWLPGQVWEKFKKGKLDEIMEECGIEDENKVKAKILSTTALWCTQYKPDDRPTMSEVVQLLKGNLHRPSPKDPYYPYSASSGSSSWGGGSTKMSGPPQSLVSSIVSSSSI